MPRVSPEQIETLTADAETTDPRTWEYRQILGT
jgi:hypothetical protein